MTQKLSRPIQFLIYAVLLAWLVFNAMPFVWTVLTSLKQVKDAFSIPPTLLFTPTLEAYAALWGFADAGGVGGEAASASAGRFVDFARNSLIVTTATVLVSLSIGCLAGYALARYTSASGFVLLALALIFRALPRISYVLPFFSFARTVNLYDTHLLLILVMVAVNQPFTIWMLRSFFMEIPVEIEEAAMMDGCSRFQAFVRVIMPLMLPGIITAGIFSLLLAYNEFLIPAILAASRASTMPIGIATIGGEDLQYWTIAAAGSVSIALPIVLIVIFAQKYIVRGLTFGAVKG